MNGQVGERILQLISGVFHVAFAICGKAEDIGQVAVDVTGVDGLEPLAVPLRKPACGIALPHGVVHIVIVLIDRGNDRLLHRVPHTLHDDVHPEVFRYDHKEHEQAECHSDDHGIALTGAGAKK